MSFTSIVLLGLVASVAADFLRNGSSIQMSRTPSVENVVNLLANGGAETGNTAGWNVADWAADTAFCYDQFPREGLYAFTTSSRSGTMSQTINVIPRSLYTLSMYIEGYFCSGRVSAFVDGKQLILHIAP